MEDLNEAIKTLVALGRDQQKADVVHAAPIADDTSATFYVVAPAGQHMLDVTKEMLAARPRPRRRTGRVELLALDSLVLFINKFREGTRTVVFANTEERSLTAIMNYHDPLNTAETTVSIDESEEVTVWNDTLGEPRWGDFRATYAFPLSRQWLAWKSIDGRKLSQSDLAHFIEDNIRDVGEMGIDELPDNLLLLVNRLRLTVATPGRLLETARGLEIQSNEKVRNAINTDTGEQVLIYEQEHSQGGSGVAEVRVPTAFLLTIPVYQNDAPYLLLARLRYRKQGPGVLWEVNIQGSDAALEDAFARGCDVVTQGTGVPLLRGKAPGVSAP